MIGTIVAAPIVLVLLFALVQFGLLWAGHGAVETAAHFAARKFAMNAREDLRKARESALAEATRMCRNRPGGRLGDASVTSVDFARDGRSGPQARAFAGDAYRVRLTHWVELVVPWAGNILYAVAPVAKAQVGGRHYLILESTRWVTVE